MAIVLCMAAVTAVRLHQYGKWKDAPANYFVNDTPIATTLDAFYWVRLARQYKAGTYSKDSADTLRNYPDGIPNPARLPLLCIMIAKLSEFFDDNLYVTGVYLIMFLSGLFLIPFMVYFSRSGYPAAGIVGGLIGSFSSVYFSRSSVGWIDTDTLNLFFPFLTSLFILLASNVAHKRYTYAYCALTGVTLFVFSYWYTSWHFFIAYLITLVISLLVNKTPAKDILIGTVIFLLISVPGVFGDKLPVVFLIAAFVAAGVMAFVYSTDAVNNKWIKWAITAVVIAALLYQATTIDRATATGLISNARTFVSTYILRNLSDDQPSLNQPTRLSTGVASVAIREVIREPLPDILSYILTNQILSVVGLVLLLLFAVLNVKKTIPLAPVIFVGLMSLLGSSRFVMYLAPLVGVGYGYALTVGSGFVLEKLHVKRPLLKELLPYALALAFVFFALILKQTSYDYVPSPSITPETYSNFLYMKDRLPHNSVILSWWDNGYAIEDLTKTATFIDGGAQRGNKTYLISHAITSKSQVELYNVISLLNGNGSSVTPEAVLDGSAINSVLDGVKNDRLYLLFTRDMILKFAWIYSIRGVDPVRHSPRSELALVYLQCNTFVNNVYGCNKYQVDMSRGIVNDTYPIKKAIYIREGAIIQQVDYPRNDGMYLQLFVRDRNVFALYLLNEEVYASNFNQMYVLGKYDKDLYEEVYNNFPVLRLFKVKQDVGKK
ncbi:oligosaccharyl transferase stt3 subunit [Candidatus Magnetobacterium bavaricum]|uniref:Oligosaccharyl transferase stt3 subunit n=1 Tax=Candidatus Magnetobacterium bavaricum TaxID=29290 RepID=A0A0F3GSS3_9BACT|nr:oligosaccharyl transferase stt3 subunit [Candidatus Magnetobacterium bavaricum]